MDMGGSVRALRIAVALELVVVRHPRQDPLGTTLLPSTDSSMGTRGARGVPGSATETRARSVVMTR